MHFDEVPGDPWTDPGGTPLKFQAGDYVEIDTTKNTERAAGLRFRCGYVTGYDILSVDGNHSAAYELFKMGDNPSPPVREEVLIRRPDPLPHTCPRGVQCGICGNGGTVQGLSIFAGPKITWGAPS